MIVVLDTNALLMCLPKKSDYRPIFDKLIEGAHSIAITNEILNEYPKSLKEKPIHELQITLQNFSCNSQMSKKSRHISSGI